MQAVLNLAQALHKQASARVSTGDLNRVVRQALVSNPPPMRQNRRAKVFYATQADTNPPTIVLFTNSPELFDNTYQRYLLKTFRDQLPFNDLPIKLYLRQRGRDDKEPEEEGHGKKRKRPRADAPGLTFKTDLTADEASGDSPYESELWKDL